MTSELKPNYVKFAREICQFAFEGCDADGFTIQEIGVKCGILKVEGFDEEKHPNIVNAEDFEGGEDVYLFVEPSAAPDVPELERYYHNRFAMVPNPMGEYVLYAQAAAVIAAERAENEKLKEQNDKFKWQVRDTCTRAESAEAKLAQIEDIIKDPDAVHIALLRGDIAKPTEEQISHVYAAPIPAPDLKAENERYKNALNEIIERSHNDPLGTSKVVDMRNIADLALTSEKQP